jgi:chromate reductase
MTKKIAVIVGSLRKDSFNKKFAQELIKLAPKDFEMEIVPIGQLSLYNQDLDNSPPEEWLEFRKKIKAADGYLFATPEYNRSMPGVLKNAIDIASRPYGQSSWDGKPGAVISVSPGMTGAFGANHHLRQSLVFLNVPCMQQPEFYVGKVSDLLDGQGDFKSSDTTQFLQKFMDSFVDWINTNSKEN